MHGSLDPSAPVWLRLLRLVQLEEVQWDPTRARAFDLIGGETFTGRVEVAERAGWVTVPRHGDRTAPVTLSGAGQEALARAEP